MTKLEPTRTSSNPTATERLRELLDERGIKWVAVTSLITYFEVDGREYRAYEYDGMGEQLDGLQIVNTTPYTPEQAIAATLGSGTCKAVQTGGSSWTCSKCGCEWRYRDSDGEPFMDVGGSAETPRFCPWCGAKVVDE